MRFLTLTAPWGSLIALGCKRIETRGWSTPYRGPIAIHQGQSLGPGGQQAFFKRCFAPRFREALEPAMILPQRIGRIAQGVSTVDPRRLPLGFIIAVAELVDVRPIPPRLPVEMGYTTPERVYRWPLTEQEVAFGDYRAGRFAWLLADVRPLREPLQWKGAQGLRVLPAETAAEVRRRAA